MALKDSVKEPTIFGIFLASILAIFQLINTSGRMDDIVNSFFPEIEKNGINEKLVFPTGSNPEDFWGVLEPYWLDYIIMAYLAYTLTGMWLHRPIEPGTYRPKKKKQKLIIIKSRKWLRLVIFGIPLSILVILNKLGQFGDLVFNFFPDTDSSGKEITLVDGSVGWAIAEWSLIDYLQIIILVALIIVGFRRGIKIDTSRIVPTQPKSAIDRIERATLDAIRNQNRNEEGGEGKINTAFADLVNMLGASVTLNLAATSLEEGNVKSAFGKWKNLTHEKGKQSLHWKELSESIDQMGNFKTDEEE